jgi:hypothetical protein
VTVMSSHAGDGATEAAGPGVMLMLSHAGDGAAESC